MTIKEIKEQLRKNDEILDDMTISDEEFDRIESLQIELTKQLAEAETLEYYISLPNVKVTQWEKMFLESFGTGTSIISRQTYYTLKTICPNDEFRVNNMICSYGFGQTFGHINISYYNL